MAENKTVHSAAPSAAGYLYQARLALAECLRFAYAESGIDISIEKLDDVSFEKADNALELLQTKHHLKKAGDLSDTSVDLWKTLHVWADATKADPSLPGRTRFCLITTASAPTGSAASLLRPADPSAARDLRRAEALLTAAAAASKNVAIGKAFAAFTGLMPTMRRALLASIEILDGAPLVGDLGLLIEDRLRMIAPRGKADVAREQLEGWWWPRICRLLQGTEPGIISILEVEQKLDDIREGFKREALPLDMEHVDPAEEELVALDEMKFVRQLSTIGIGATRLQYAKRDYYRAFAQRSRWIRHSLLFDGEVSRFERILLEEWQPRFSKMCDGIAADCADTVLQQAGRDLYHWVESEARFPFRTITSRFLTVGSYHMLANELRIGWHRNYDVLCADNQLESA
jgi:hypothetical protein